MSKACVFFDRDGIVNQAPAKTRYVERWSDFHLQPEFVETLKVVRDKGYEAVVVTNQKGVGTGYVSPDTLAEIHENLKSELAKQKLCLLDIVVCTDTADDSPRRKPNPGMLLEAAEKYDLDLARSWMIGDQKKDIEAGQRAGCQTVFIGPAIGSTGADYALPRIADLPAFLRKHLQGLV
jgi:D-glycero-D-manno-heptose 1,7-bisphosphate phosphatase